MLVQSYSTASLYETEPGCIGCGTCPVHGYEAQAKADARHEANYGYVALVADIEAGYLDDDYEDRWEPVGPEPISHAELDAMATYEADAIYDAQRSA